MNRTCIARKDRIIKAICKWPGLLPWVWSNIEKHRDRG